MQEISTVFIVSFHSILPLFIHLLFSLSFTFILINLSISARHGTCCNIKSVKLLIQAYIFLKLAAAEFGRVFSYKLSCKQQYLLICYCNVRVTMSGTHTEAVLNKLTTPELVQLLLKAETTLGSQITDLSKEIKDTPTRHPGGCWHSKLSL